MSNAHGKTTCAASWPEDWPEWVTTAFGELEQAENETDIDLPEDAPKWVERVLTEFHVSAVLK